jgi:hypothetical protein
MSLPGAAQPEVSVFSSLRSVRALALVALCTLTAVLLNFESTAAAMSCIAISTARPQAYSVSTQMNSGCASGRHTDKPCCPT